MNRRAFLPAAVLPMLLALGLAACSPRDGFHAIDITGAGYGRDFRLTDVTGTERTLADYRGRAVLVFFGFTQCPDACPTALSRAVAIRDALGELRDRIVVVFITLDPERDTSEILGAYMSAFDPAFVGLRGDAKSTQTAAEEFHVFHRKVPTGSSYTMDHSTLTYVFDPTGRLRLAVRHEAPAAAVAQDLRKLILATS